MALINRSTLAGTASSSYPWKNHGQPALVLAILILLGGLHQVHKEHVALESRMESQSPSSQSSSQSTYPKYSRDGSTFGDDSYAYPYKLNSFYSYSRIERYTIEHAVQLKYSRNYVLAGTTGEDDEEEEDDDRVDQADDATDPATNPDGRLPHSAAARGCTLWQPSKRTIYEGFIQQFLPELDLYNRLLQNHPGSPIADIRTIAGKGGAAAAATRKSGKSHNDTTAIEDICHSLEVHERGLGAIFATGSLSRSPHGLLEPIYPPFGSISTTCPRVVSSLSGESGLGPLRRKRKQPQRPAKSHDLDFLVHDFASHCRQMLPESTSSSSSKPKIILVDIGYKALSKWQDPTTSSNNKKDKKKKKQKVKKSKVHPTHSLLQLYQKFGFPVDEIHVFDTTQRPKGSQSWISRIFKVKHGTRKHGRSSRSSIVDYTWANPQTKASRRSNHPWEWISSERSVQDLVLVTVQFPPRNGLADGDKDGDDDDEEEDATSLLEQQEELMALLQELMDLPQLAERLDGLYFHPIIYMGEDEPSGSTPSKGKTDRRISASTMDPRTGGAVALPRLSIQDAMQLFVRLRERGFMAHSFAN